MTAALAHVAALQLILNIAEGSTTANSLPHIAKIARAALGGRPLGCPASAPESLIGNHDAHPSMPASATTMAWPSDIAAHAHAAAEASAELEGTPR